MSAGRPPSAVRLRMPQRSKPLDAEGAETGSASPVTRCWDENEYYPGDRGMWTMIYSRPQQ